MKPSTPIEFDPIDINIVKPKSPIEVKIVESYIASLESSPNFVRHITFDVEGTPLEGNIKAGQSIGIVPPGVDEKGKPHKVRLYSVSSPSYGEDGKGKRYSTTVKRVIDEHWDTQELYTGVCSNYLCSRRVGDTVMAAGPSGKRFVFPKNPGDYNYVFLGTGTGVAPFRGMVKELLETGAKSSISLLFGTPYRTDLLYYRWFKELAENHTNFNYYTAISREGRRKDGSKTYVQHLLLDYKDDLFPILQQDNTLIYICGLKGMEPGIFKNLIDLNLTEYITQARGFEDIAFDEMDWTQIKTGIKADERMFVETY